MQPNILTVTDTLKASASAVKATLYKSGTGASSYASSVVDSNKMRLPEYRT